MTEKEKRLKTYQTFNQIITERNITPYKVATDLGFSPMALSDWKNGKSRPKIEKLLAIAEYLNVDVSAFTVGVDKE